MNSLRQSGLLCVGTATRLGFRTWESLHSRPDPHMNSGLQTSHVTVRNEVCLDLSECAEWIPQDPNRLRAAV